MNIRPTTEREHKLRYSVDHAKLKRIKRETDERREKSGRASHKIHERYASDALPDAADLKAWVREYRQEHGRIPSKLLWPYFTKSKTVIVFDNDLGACVTLQIIKDAEFVGLASD